MIRLTRDVRLIPIVLLATVSLLALKVSGLVFDGGYTLAERLQGRNHTDLRITNEPVPDYPKIVVADRAMSPDNGPRKPWAREMFNYNDNRDVTGAIGENDKAAVSVPQLKVSDKPPEPPQLQIAGSNYPLEQGKINSPGERAVLERLQDRRQELDSRSRDIEMRETLLKAAEKRLEAKVSELKEIETRVNTAMGNRDKQEAERFKSLVSMYENMKAKEAARIFDRLDLAILVQVAMQITPRKMSEIMAMMTPDSAERLTVELARTGHQPAQSSDQLPKIEGKPN